MGCDIHIYVEVKKELNGNQQWIDANLYERNPYYGQEEERAWYPVEIYQGRNYFLFSLLADVRNHTGMAPICQPKGIPSDCSESIRDEFEYWKDDAHSASWFTLWELMEVKGNRPEGALLQPIIEGMREVMKRKYMKEKDWRNIRVVFWFDN